LFTHFQRLYPASVRRAELAPRTNRCGMATLSDTSRSLKKSAG
jgi:hypothetical protein